MSCICTLEHWKGINNLISSEEYDTAEAISLENKYRKEALLYGAKHDFEHILYAVIQYNTDLDIISTISYFSATSLTSEELTELINRFPDSEFRVVHPHSKSLCQRTLAEEKSKRIEPITLKKANRFVVENHRHHDSVTGCKFAIGLTKEVKGERKLIGVAVCGRPVSKYLDDGFTLEINRLCVTEGGNACSMLYSRCCKTARDMGYRKVITYILESECGSSLKASGFVLEAGHCGGAQWTGTRQNKHKKQPPKEYKQRWVKYL